LISRRKGATVGTAIGEIPSGYTGMVFGRLQADLLERATMLVGTGGEFQNLLFVGPKGCGKRTIAASLAASFGLDFVCVPMDEGVGAIRDRLFGTPTEAARAADGGAPPGAFRAGPPTFALLHPFPPGPS